MNAAQFFQSILSIAKGQLIPIAIKFLNSINAANGDPIKWQAAVITLQADILAAAPNLVSSEISALTTLLVSELQKAQPPASAPTVSAAHT